MPDPSADAEHSRSPGRPPDPRVEEQIVVAARRVIVAEGWRGLTFDNVARSAGVARSTLYRRYGTVSGLMLALMQGFYDEAEVSDTGTLHGDLSALMNGIHDIWVQPDNVKFLAAVVAALGTDPNIAAAYREQHRERRTETRLVLERAVERGEIDGRFDHELILDLLAGFITQRVIFTGVPVSRAAYAQAVDVICTALGAPGPQPG